MFSVNIIESVYKWNLSISVSWGFFLLGEQYSWCPAKNSTILDSLSPETVVGSLF